MLASTKENMVYFVLAAFTLFRAIFAIVFDNTGT